MRRTLPLALLAAAGLALTACAGQPAAAPVTVTETELAPTEAPATPEPAATPSFSARSTELAADVETARAKAESLGFECTIDKVSEAAITMPTEITVGCDRPGNSRSASGLAELEITVTSNMERTKQLHGRGNAPVRIIGNALYFCLDQDVLAGLTA